MRREEGINVVRATRDDLGERGWVDDVLALVGRGEELIDGQGAQAPG